MVRPTSRIRKLEFFRLEDGRLYCLKVTCLMSAALCKGWLYLTRSYVAEPGYLSPDVRAWAVVTR